MKTFESTKPRRKDTSLDEGLKQRTKPHKIVSNRQINMNKTIDRKEEDSREEIIQNCRVSVKINQVMLTLGRNRESKGKGGKVRPNMVTFTNNKKALEAYPLNQPSFIQQPNKHNFMLIDSKLTEKEQNKNKIKAETNQCLEAR